MQNSDLNTEPGEGETVSSTHREVVSISRRQGSTAWWTAGHKQYTDKQVTRHSIRDERVQDTG